MKQLGWFIVLLVGLLDQVPVRPDRRAAINEQIAQDQAIAIQLEAELPPRAMVFVLPVLRYPEGGPIGAVGEYEPMRPYLWTKTLRFSYGSNQGRAQEAWQFAVEQLPVPALLAKLETYGFSAVYVDRRGVNTNALADLGGRATWTRGPIQIIRLQASARYRELP